MRRVIFPLLRIAVLLAVQALVACGGGGMTVQQPNPTSTPTPGPIILTPSSLSFLDVGASLAQSVSATLKNYSGPFSADASACAGIASIAATAGAGNFLVTPIGVGTCDIRVTADSQKATIGVSVTTSSVIIGSVIVVIRL